MGPRVRSHIEPFRGESAKLGPVHRPVLAWRHDGQLDPTRVGHGADEFFPLGDRETLRVQTPLLVTPPPPSLILYIENMDRAAMSEGYRNEWRALKDKPKAIGPEP